MDVTAMVNTIPHGQIPLDPSAPHSLRSAFATPANSPSLASLAATTASVSASVPSSGENNLEVVPSPGGDELGDLLSGLGLDGECSAAYCCRGLVFVSVSIYRLVLRRM
ncbi:hypothetical protein OE88DRAFT_1658789 [Heliocybe sulcata]|uniref:Uncharacterized protein n=1 Tax=Heliocybe sulcata TaxID=5364 RepID=A0A5C3N5A2_9AGAM|nr:hypothetical protein OE88DRAFT_1658789 [Heliocybe sulcata]